MKDYEFLKIGSAESICTLTISAPKSLNALNSSILKEMDDFLSNLDPDIRVLIITGDGEKSFVAGADISEMQPLGPEEGEHFGAFGASVFRKIETLPIPVIAAVNGFALGGGCELTLACDIRLASNRAKFGQPEVGLGIIPGFSGTYRLAKIAGMGVAKELIFSGRAIKADEALRIGLVNAVYEPEQLMEEAVNQRGIRPARRRGHRLRKPHVRQMLRHQGPEGRHDRLPHQDGSTIHKRINIYQAII